MKNIEETIKGVFVNPTAPFRENWVLDHVKRELAGLKVPWFTDSWGNIIAGARHSNEIKNSRRIALMAHTDHPGFHLLSPAGKNIWNARWFGGCPPKISNADVAIHNPRSPSRVWHGRVVSKKLRGQKRQFKIRLRADANEKSARLDNQCFGAFDYPGFSKKGNRVFTRAADDLSGVAIILSTFARLSKKERGSMLGIFTRAEEVGFRGALGIIYGGILGRSNGVISLEASRQLPGARLGRGPVIRLGDKKSMFDATVTARLDAAATAILKREKKFRTQRRIMNGGTCEATPFHLHGIRASGIAVPLGNYHNERSSGRPGAEYIDLRDVEGAVKLCVEFFKQLARKQDPTADYLSLLKKGFRKDVPFLKHRVSFEKR